METKPTVAAPRMRPRLAITLGDPNGIGPEVVLKCLSDARLNKYMQPLVVGSAHVLRVHANKLGYRDTKLEAVTEVPETLPADRITVLDTYDDRKPWVDFGQVTETGGRLAMHAVAQAVDLCCAGQADGMVTAPISKAAIAKAGFSEPGHTEFITQRVGSTAHTMMMVADGLRVGLVTGHVPIWDVPKGITEAAILEKVRIIQDSLRTDFGITRPRIAVLGLNPHAGDGGVLGHEEQDIIIPAIQAAAAQDFLAFGPFPADGFFAMNSYRVYDAVLAMYHDQGLVPFKTLAFDTGVNFTAGLPIVRTSPDHGTAYDIAGQGKASPRSMRSAMYVAIDVARRRLRQAQHQASTP